jgi:hypothetical protein
MSSLFYGKIEQALTEETIIKVPEFAQVIAASNPDNSLITSFPACQWWYESSNTRSTHPEFGTIWLTKEIFFGNVILFPSSGQDESQDRDKAYELFEKLMVAILGFQPMLEQFRATIFPISPIEDRFTQLDSGMTALTSYWSLLCKFGKDGGS